MNYYAARERKDADGQPSGLYHYTCTNDGQTWPVGYCADGCPGHISPALACEHYKAYQLDTALTFSAGEQSEVQHKCRVCQAWTTGYAFVAGWHSYPLCDEHRTREHVEALYSVGESWES